MRERRAIAHRPRVSMLLCLDHNQHRGGGKQTACEKCPRGSEALPQQACDKAGEQQGYAGRQVEHAERGAARVRRRVIGDKLRIEGKHGAGGDQHGESATAICAVCCRPS